MTLELIHETATFHSSSMVIPEETTQQQWADIGRNLIKVRNVTQWYLGDWSEFGERHFRSSFKEFARIHGLDYSTLRHLAFVSKSIPPERRREKLSWAYHAEVAQLKLFEQGKWLGKVETEGMSTAGLRKEIRLAQGDEEANESDGKAVSFASKHVDALVKWIKSMPEDFWEDDERRQIWADLLRPIAERYEKLTALKV